MSTFARIKVKIFLLVKKKIPHNFPCSSQRLLMFAVGNIFMNDAQVGIKNNEIHCSETYWTSKDFVNKLHKEKSHTLIQKYNLG